MMTQKKWKPKLKISLVGNSDLRNTKLPFLAGNPRLESFPVLKTSKLNIFISKYSSVEQTRIYPPSCVSHKEALTPQAFFKGVA